MAFSIISDFWFAPATVSVAAATLLLLGVSIFALRHLIAGKKTGQLAMIAITLSSVAVVANASLTVVSNNIGVPFNKIAPIELLGLVVLGIAIAVNGKLLRGTSALLLLIASVGCIIAGVVSIYSISLGVRNPECTWGWLAVNTGLWSARILHFNAAVQALLIAQMLWKELIAAQKALIFFSLAATAILFCWGAYGWQSQLGPTVTDYVG